MSWLKRALTTMFYKLFCCSVMVFLLIGKPLWGNDFKDDQKRYKRVRAAYKEKEGQIKKLFENKGVPYPPEEIFLRAFKQEDILEAWALTSKSDSFSLLKTYKICSKSGELGPKRKQGDLQVPEGFYYIDRFNPASSYHLSLAINYPNPSDRILSDADNLGGDIFIHGNCVTIGCIPITDDKIKELYLIAVEAKNNGQDRIPVHIFPCKFTSEKFSELMVEYGGQKNLISFWDNLRQGYDKFEKKHRLPKIIIDENGKYIFEEK